MTVLNLVRVELGKLFRGKTFWIVTVLFIASIFSTFIPLSYVEDVRESLESVGQVVTGEEGIYFTDQNGITINIAEDWAELDEIDWLIRSIQQSGNFVQNFYTASSGQIAVLMIIVTIFVIADFVGGTIRSTLFAGYSRDQIYLTKLFTGFLGSCLYLLIAMVSVAVLGVAFYGMRLTAGSIQTMAAIWVAQCLMALQCCAVFTAFSFVFGNGLAFLGSILFLCVLPGGLMLGAVLAGRELTFAAAYLPSLIRIGGENGFFTLEQMVASPQLWTAAFVLKALLVMAVVTVGTTLAGMFAFRKKNL